MIEVRESLPEDADDLRIVDEHMNRSLRSVYQPTHAGYANRSRISRDLTRLVALSGGRLVGTTLYYIEDDLMRILGLGVHEAHRRQGIARSLVVRVLELAKEKGCPAVRLSTIKETGNVPIFERLGFEVVGENVDDLYEGIGGGKVTDVEMERRLGRN